MTAPPQDEAPVLAGDQEADHYLARHAHLLPFHRRALAESGFLGTPAEGG